MANSPSPIGTTSQDHKLKHLNYLLHIFYGYLSISKSKQNSFSDNVSKCQKV